MNNRFSPFWCISQTSLGHIEMKLSIIVPFTIKVTSIGNYTLVCQLTPWDSYGM